MADSPRFVDPKLAPPRAGEINPHARIVQGTTHTGKPCRIVDNTGSVAEAQLREVLEALIRERRFGPGGLSVAGGNRIAIDAPIATHIQFGDRLYRLLLFPYEARVEDF